MGPLLNHNLPDPATDHAAQLAAHLIDEARRRLGNRGAAGMPRGHRAVNFYQQGLEQHHPVAGRYDVIWLQWAALYLTDGE